MRQELAQAARLNRMLQVYIWQTVLYGPGIWAWTRNIERRIAVVERQLGWLQGRTRVHIRECDWNR